MARTLARRSGIAALIAALQVIGWGRLIAAVGSHHRVSAGAFGIGIGVTAYTLGMRHTLDVDHIPAIDTLPAS